MKSGLTTSQAITRAYLDRIKVYDQGQFGFNSYEIVASDALEQARKADEARAAGKRSPVLGVPIRLEQVFVNLLLNAAHSIGLGNGVGSIEIGKRGDLLLLNCDDYRFVTYEFGGNLVESVFKKGKLVYESK